MPVEEKKEILAKLAEIWDTLSEREQGRLQGRLEAYEQIVAEGLTI